MLLVVAAVLAADCATLAVRDAPSSPLFGTGFGERPVVDESFPSERFPLVIRRGPGGTVEQAQLALAEAEAAWVLQVEGAGWPEPLPDDVDFDDDGGDARLDIYLDTLPPGVGAVTISGGSSSTRPVFISIDPAQPDELLAVAVHHELQHALQFAVDARESVMWFESNAVFWEIKGRPDVDAWLDLAASFQRQPHAPLFTDALAFSPFSSIADDSYEYGAALLALYLDDEHGAGDGSFLRALWQASAQAGEANEPDWIDALEGQGDSFASVVADFSTWRALTGSRRVLGIGPAVETDDRAALGGRAVLLESLAGVERVTTEGEGPFVGGCAVFIGTANASAVPVRLEATSVDGHALTLATLVIDELRESAIIERAPDVLEVDVPARATIVMNVCDVSPADADDDPVFAPVRVRLSRTDVVAEGEGEGEEGEGEEGEGEEGEGEEGEEGEGETDCGCCCQSTGDPRSMQRNIGTFAFFAAVFGFGVKAWRHLKRKRMYKRRDDDAVG